MKTQLLFCGVVALAWSVGSPLSFAQQSVSGPDQPVPVEFSGNLDRQDAGAAGGIGALDPGQNLYTEPLDTASDPRPRDISDWFGAIESGIEPDSQVDALANGEDGLLADVLTNNVELLVSLKGDPAGGGAPAAAIHREDPAGGHEALYTHAHLNHGNPVAIFNDLDAMEFWGPVGSGDATFFSLNGDVTGVSVFVRVAGNNVTYIDQFTLHPTLPSGFTGNMIDVDVDALMVNDANANQTWDTGDEILFSLAEGFGLHGGEIMHLQFGSPATFLSHGGHDWDSGFHPGLALTGQATATDDVDALEAAPTGQIVSPASISIPLAPFWVLLFLALGLLMLLRRRQPIGP
jgi:hypothetical protein